MRPIPSEATGIKDASGKKFALCNIMDKVHVLAATAWPRDVPEAGLHAIIDIQVAVARALGLPEDLDLMTGDPRIDIT